MLTFCRLNHLRFKCYRDNFGYFCTISELFSKKISWPNKKIKIWKVSVWKSWLIPWMGYNSPCFFASNQWIQSFNEFSLLSFQINQILTKVLHLPNLPVTKARLARWCAGLRGRRISALCGPDRVGWFRSKNRKRKLSPRPMQRKSWRINMRSRQKWLIGNFFYYLLICLFIHLK